MARITKLEPEQWDPSLRELFNPDDRTPLEQGLMRFFAHRPELARGLIMFSGSLKRKRTLEDRLVELMRLRIAFHNQCRSCMAIRYTDALEDGLTEDLVCSLEKPLEATDLTERERLAVRYGELFATNHLAIDDAFYDEMRQHFSEAEIVELGMTAAFFVGFGRLGATWHMVEELPSAFQGQLDDGPVAPWRNEAIVVR
jgi:alkylhydroperoxidase family enzyme